MMTIPFLDFFKKKTAKGQPVMAVSPAAVPAKEKPSGERLSKTVLPNATRSSRHNDLLQTPNGTAIVPGPRPFSLGGGTGSNRSTDLPPAVALAIEPKVERVIALDLADVAEVIPAGFVRPVSEAEAGRGVLLKAAELEKGMSSGRPSVSVASIYRQVPEIFVRPVADSDSTQVYLPFEKVLEQFKTLHTRSDQHRDRTVPQVETPFLKVTLEDNSKFGIETGPIEIAEMPEARIELATAQSIAAAHPEVALGIKAPEPIALTKPTISKANGRKPNVTAPPSIAPSAPAAPTRIPFKLSPTGPDVPDSESVPASSGPSVPIAPAPAGPTRIPFKLAPPTEETPAKAEPWLTKENFEEGSKDVATEEPAAPAPELPDLSAKTDVKISLLLKPVLQTLPPFQMAGDITAVPDDARFEIPFSLIESQLASGRVSVKPDEFAAALPANYKGLFSAKEIAAPVALLLQDVLKNLPSASLRMRSDQEEPEKGVGFATPFSAKADEDAKRFKHGGPVEAKPLKGMVATKPKPIAEPPAAEKKAETSAGPAAEKEAKVSRSALQAALDTDEEVDAKAVVAHVGQMAGVKACAIMFGDGLSLAGNLPEEYAADGLCAMAPSLLQKVGDHMTQTKLGSLRAMTLFCAQAAVTFFMHDNLCLAALHAKEELASDVRERLARAVHELSKKYSHPV